MIYKPKFNLKDTVYIDRKFSSLSSSFFKPIVATSLLFLLPSLGMGADGTGKTYEVGGTGPKISVTTSETKQSENLSWDKACSGNTTSSCTATGTSATWTSDSTTWSGTIGGKNITDLLLRFDNDNTTSFVYNSTTTSGSTTTTATGVYASGKNATVINADFGGKSLGTSDSKINLDLRFGSSSVANGNKKITVSDLDTLNGTLYIRSGNATTSSTSDVYTYDITLNTLNGILAVQGSNYFMQGTVTIKKSMVGSIYVSGNSSPSSSGKTSDTAGLTLKFENGATMQGDILDRANGQAGIRKDIYFAGSGNVLTGNIVSFGTGSGDTDYLNTNAGNRIYFTQGSMTGYIIASTGQKTASDGNVSKKGLNVVIFGDTNSATTHTLTGGILASDIQNTTGNSDTSTKQATNVIVLADSTTLNIKDDGKGTTLTGSFASGALTGGDNGNDTSKTTYSVTSGSIVARNYGVNEIRIYKDSTLNLNDGSGSITSVVNDVANITTKVNGSALKR